MNNIPGNFGYVPGQVPLPGQLPNMYNTSPNQPTYFNRGMVPANQIHYFQPGLVNNFLPNNLYPYSINNLVYPRFNNAMQPVQIPVAAINPVVFNPLQNANFQPPSNYNAIFDGPKSLLAVQQKDPYRLTSPAEKSKGVAGSAALKGFAEDKRKGTMKKTLAIGTAIEPQPPPDEPEPISPPLPTEQDPNFATDLLSPAEKSNNFEVISLPEIEEKKETKNSYEMGLLLAQESKKDKTASEKLDKEKLDKEKLRESEKLAKEKLADINTLKQNSQSAEVDSIISTLRNNKTQYHDKNHKEGKSNKHSKRKLTHIKSFTEKDAGGIHQNKRKKSLVEDAGDIAKNEEESKPSRLDPIIVLTSDSTTQNSPLPLEVKRRPPRRSKEARVRRSKEKKEKKRSSKSKTPPSIAISYYSKSSKKETVEAKPELLKLHRRFERHCQSFQSSARKKVNELIPHNPQNVQQCNCPSENRARGIHHEKYPGGQMYIDACKKLTNNADRLYHYKIKLDPLHNFTTRRPSAIYHDGKEFEFEGFSVFSHASYHELPPYTFKRNLFEYTITLEKISRFPKNFCIKDLELIEKYWFKDLFELNDWNFEETCGCPLLHFMPRFICKDTKESEECLPMAQLLVYLIESYSPFYEDKDVCNDWKEFDKINKGFIVFNREKKPSALRVDHVPRDNNTAKEFIHTASSPGIEEVSLKDFKSVTDDLNKIKKVLKNRAVPTKADKQKLYQLQQKLNDLRDKRGGTRFQDVSLPMEGYYNTGLRWDVFQHTSYLHGFWKYIRFMLCLHVLEENINYTFTDKALLKTALTLPSYQDQSSMALCTHNSIHNLGKRSPDINSSATLTGQVGTRKKGVMNLANTMVTLLNEKKVTKSKCPHNERLEFLGDALLDYLTSLHLFLMFPDKGAGKLTQFRIGIVQTENLFQIAQRVNLEDFLLLSHHRLELQPEVGTDKSFEHYLANAVESIIGAVYLDGGLNAVDKLLSTLLFSDEEELAIVWKNNKKHPLQETNPNGDREMIKTSKTLQKMCDLEKTIGIEFKNIRLLARAFTHSVAGLEDSTLTGGDYNRLEFLGDAILKYVSSDYLYKHFPEHQEGHLTLLRISMINAKCLTTAALDLGLDKFIIYESLRGAQTVKSKVYSDVFEALLGAVHIDRNQKGIQYCQKIIEISILSRLNEFIINQEWLDPKSQLQQCCNSVRDPGTPEDYPQYNRDEEYTKNGLHMFKVSVYFQGRKLGTGTARSTKDAEKEAAKDALDNNHYEQHARQKRLIYKKFGPSKPRTEEIHPNGGEHHVSPRKDVKPESQQSPGETEHAQSTCTIVPYEL